MSTQRSATLTTADDLLRRPGDGYRYELVRGELRQMTPSGYAHGVVVANLTGPLERHVRAHSLGQICGAETGFRIGRSPDTVRAPDIAFVRRARQGAEPLSEGFFEGAPDLAVEVLSPSDTVYEVEEKVTDWLTAGCSLVWVVSPKRRSVSLHRAGAPVVVLRDTDTLDGGDVVPGFTLRVAQIFEW
ncbi:MAG: Uma2 family endonuclease [Acidobacteria bacterium]|nr:Uma2 family endonuclease [Acidobacteriota bacterium]